MSEYQALIEMFFSPIIMQYLENMKTNHEIVTRLELFLSLE